MLVIFKLFTKYKSIASALGILIVLGGLYTTYQNIKDSWYQEGVLATTISYERKMTEMQQEYITELKEKLADYRVTMNNNFTAELERVKAEQTVKIQIQEVLRYVDKEIEVPVACNNVPVKFSSLLNQAINSVNGVTPATNQ
jgi:L-lactate utilization protein LutC